MRTPERHPRVSVIVPVHNGGDDVRGLLAALERQSIGCDAFEVVVADDGSTDGTLDGLEHGALDLRVIPGPRSSSYAARNRGARLARAPVLAFTDADCRPDPAWIERGLTALGSADLVAGAVHFAPDGPVGVWGMLDIDLYLDQERMVRNRTAATANLLVSRAAFDRAGEFDPALASNGDHEFVRRSVARGERLAFAADAAVRHPVRDGRQAFLRKWWRTHRAFGARCGRDGRPSHTWKLAVPIWRTYRSRRWHGRPVGLDIARLSASGVRPGPLQRTTALVLLYLVLPLTAFAAQTTGLRAGRRLRVGGTAALEVAS